MSTACKQQIECAKLTAPMPVDCKGLLHLIVMVRYSKKKQIAL
jgi:hypothetical protein